MRNVPKLGEYVLSNTYLVSFTSLYFDKAGISLALFEASKYFQNEEMENAAFKLLQEALILKSADFSFENGLSGIGYALHYLIENKFIEADFDELFGEQYEKTVKSLGDIEKHPERLLNTLQVIYFLSSVRKIKPNDERPQRIIKKIFEGLELFLMIQFQDFLDIHYINDKMAVLRIYETYLKLVDDTNYSHFSRSLLENYANLYRKDKVVSSIAIGYYLGMLARKNAITDYNDVVKNQIENGIRNIHEDMLSLGEKIDLTKLLFDVESNGIAKLPDIKTDYLPENINVSACPLHYKNGAARLLLFCVNKQAELL